MNNENSLSICRKRKKPTKNVKSEGRRETRDGEKTTIPRYWYCIDNNTNKAFEKIERFDGSNPEQCLPWMEMIVMIHNHNRNPREELLLNSGGSIRKILYAINPEATPGQIKDIWLCNHSNLMTPLQHMSAFQSIQQKSDEVLQTYNTRYESYYQLAHPGLTIDNDPSKVSCIHCANSLHGKLGDEMEGRFNQELPDNLQAAFQRTVNFEPRILTKQWINTRKVNEVNHIDVTRLQFDQLLYVQDIWNRP